MKSKTLYGKGNSSYKAAGEISGITKLVDTFYNFMEEFAEAKDIHAMHSQDPSISRLKLAYFLSGWLGGPKLYAKHFGTINIPKAHRHLPIGITEQNAWMLCMKKALDEQPYEQDFKHYLLAQLHIPASKIREACSQQMAR